MAVLWWPRRDLLVRDLSTYVILCREQFESHQSCLVFLKLTAARKDEVVNPVLVHLWVFLMGGTGLWFRSHEMFDLL